MTSLSICLLLSIIVIACGLSVPPGAVVDFRDPALFFSLLQDPLKMYEIGRHDHGKIYYLPVVNKDPLNLSQKYGFQLVNIYHDLLKDYCIEFDKLARYYYLPRYRMEEFRKLKQQMENMLMSKYCSDYYKHYDFRSPDWKEKRFKAFLHLPDLNGNRLKPFKLPIVVKRDEAGCGHGHGNVNEYDSSEMRFQHNVVKKQLKNDEQSDSIRMRHIEMGEEPCDQCKNGHETISDYTAKPFYVHELTTESSSLNDFSTNKINDGILQQCDNNMANFRTENNLIALRHYESDPSEAANADNSADEHRKNEGEHVGSRNYDDFYN